MRCIFQKIFMLNGWGYVLLPPSTGIMEQKLTSRKIHMEISSHKLSVTPHMSLTALPDFCFPLRKSRALLGAGWCFLFPPTPLAGAAKKFVSEGSWGFHVLSFSQVACKKSQSKVAVCETLVKRWTGRRKLSCQWTCRHSLAAWNQAEVG